MTKTTLLLLLLLPAIRRLLQARKKSPSRSAEPHPRNEPRVPRHPAVTLGLGIPLEVHPRTKTRTSSSSSRCMGDRKDGRRLRLALGHAGHA
jgi:hypothetical protein